MRDKILSIIKLIISLLLFFCVGAISAFVLKVFNIDVNSLSVKSKVWYQAIVSLVLFIILLFMYNKEIRKDLLKFKDNIGYNIKNIIKLFFIFLIVKYAISFLTAIIISVLKLDTSSIISVNQNLIESYVKSVPLLMVFTVSVLGPFYEEILFRLGFKKVLNKGIIFIVISGFVFGLMHIFPLEEGVSLILGIVQSISYITMGLFLAYVYNKTDNIFISIGLHFLNNFISVLTMINML